jgi:hypothetical protein
LRLQVWCSKIDAPYFARAGFCVVAVLDLRLRWIEVVLLFQDVARRPIEQLHAFIGRELRHDERQN